MLVPVHEILCTYLVVSRLITCPLMSLCQNRKLASTASPVCDLSNKVFSETTRSRLELRKCVRSALAKHFLIFQLAGARIPCGRRALIREIMAIFVCNVLIFYVFVLTCFFCLQGRCNREKPPCKYFHPPQHLKDQLLINGRNHLALKNALMQQMGISPGQPLVTGQVPAVVSTS